MSRIWPWAQRADEVGCRLAQLLSKQSFHLLPGVCGGLGAVAGSAIAKEAVPGLWVFKDAVVYLGLLQRLPDLSHCLRGN